MTEMELGGNITLVGFKDVDYRDLIIVKKIVGNQTRRLSELCSDFQNITLTLKPVHKIEDTYKNEVHLRVNASGKMFTSEATDKNIFMAMDTVFKKVAAQLESRT